MASNCCDDSRNLFKSVLAKKKMFLLFMFVGRCRKCDGEGKEDDKTSKHRCGIMKGGLNWTILMDFNINLYT